MNLKTHSPLNPAHAAARVFALLLATVGFGAMWQCDSQYQQEVLAHRERERESLVSVVAAPHDEDDADPAHPAGTQMLSDDSAAPVSQTQVTLRDVSHVRDWTLPAGIVPGEYRVVDSRGAVDLVRITPADVIDQGSIAGREAREMYLFDTPDRRVYFIRVASPDAISNGNEPARR